MNERKQDEHYWRDRNVFMTGATGFLGSRVSQASVDRGANVVGLVRDLNFNRIIQGTTHSVVNEERRAAFWVGNRQPPLIQDCSSQSIGTNSFVKAIVSDPSRLFRTRS